MANGMPHLSSDPSPLRELEAKITELVAHLKAANYRWLVLIAGFDRRKGCSDGATQSCVHDLSQPTDA